MTELGNTELIKDTQKHWSVLSAIISFCDNPEDWQAEDNNSRRTEKINNELSRFSLLPLSISKLDIHWKCKVFGNGKTNYSFGNESRYSRHGYLVDVQNDAKNKSWVQHIQNLKK